MSLPPFSPEVSLKMPVKKQNGKYAQEQTER